jgi:uncharacterized Ntn-hydrolase superfamily protein
MLQHYPTELFSTYSIIARDPETGWIGGAVQTHQMSVGRLIPVMQAGRGVIASQSLVNLRYNPIALTMLQQGLAPQQIVDGLVASDPHAARRQVAVMNNAGQIAAFTGAGCIREYGHHIGASYSVHANMMTRPTVIDAMRAAYEAAEGDLAQRMVAALYAAQAEDGDIRGMQSAALKIVSGDSQTPAWESVYDLRVDEHATPLDELARLVRLRRAQHMDSDGHQLLAQGALEPALARWQSARETAPELLELAFWQAVTLADLRPTADSVQTAAAIFKKALGQADRRQHWLDLIERISANGLIERAGAGEELRRAIST